MGKRVNKVVGYFAFSSPQDVFCTDGAACMISSSRRSMENYLSELGNKQPTTIKKTYFGEVLQGLNLGAAYAFDEESYKIFYPLAKAEGLDVKPPSVFREKPTGSRFLTVSFGLKH
ncbi:MAG: hypothetical protein HQL77_16840 [Magnetococcales bacterium]|nr:hypothetical protein [Magnetococcales bacterium]